METSRRPSLRRALASLLTGALIAAGAIVGVAAPAQAADARVLSATTTAVANTKVTVAVSGSGFTGIPVLIGQPYASFYVAFIKKGTPLDGVTQGGATVVTPVYPAVDGTVTGALEQTAANLDRTASYELIAWPSRSNPSESNLYARADVAIDWSALFPAAATTTTLTASPVGTAQAGDTVSLSASVSPVAAGSVEFFDGAVSLGASAVNDAGVAQVSTATLAEGTRSLTATFTPTDAAAFAGSTSAALSYEITAVPVVPAAPAVQVFLADGVTPYTGQPVYTDDTLVVKGSGFDPTANVGGRGVPIPNTLPQGTYVVFGSFKDVWKPSLGNTTAPASARVTTDTKWALAESVLNQVPPLYQATVRGQWTALSSTGAFEATLTAKDFARGLSDGNWGVYTYGAGGVANAAQELAVEINYLGTRPALTPAIQVFLADGVTAYTGQAVATGDELVVKGTGFDPAANVGGMGMPIPATLPQGTFVVFGSFADNWRPSQGAASSQRTMHPSSRVWALAEDVLNQVPVDFQDTIRLAWAPIADDGSFTATVTLTAPVTPLEDGNWGIYTYPGGVGTPANAAQELSVAVNYEGDEGEPEVPAGKPAVIVTPTRALDPSVDNDITVSGTGFTGAGAANGTYVLFGEASTWSGGSALPTDGWLVQAWVPTIVDGKFTTTLTIPADTLDPAKSYQVATSAAHGLSVTDRSLDTFTTVTVAKPDPGIPAKPTLNLGSSSVQQGGELVISGTGFTAGQVVTFTVDASSLLLGTVTVSPAGTFTLTGVIPSTVAAGSHILRAAVGPFTVATKSFTVVAAPVDPELPEPEAPEPPTCVAQAVSGATFQWGVKESFRAYVSGPIAKGTYSLSWGTGSGAFDTVAHAGRVSFSGTAHFAGHGGELDLVIASPRIQVTSATTAELIVDVASKGLNGTGDVLEPGVAFAELTLPAATTTSGQISWTDAAAVLTEAGAEAFSGFYQAGAALDPISFSFPLGKTADCGPVDPENPGTPGTPLPETGGPSVEVGASTAAQGGTVTFSGSDLKIGDRVRIEVHSTPLVIADFVLDATSFSYVWTVPSDFEEGAHTLYVFVNDRILSQSSFAVTPAAVDKPEPSTPVEQPVVATCTAQAVAGASLSWNVKQSFRDYIGGPIAKGSYSINWASGSGAYNTTDNRGRVSFGGSASFSGHSGLLDLTISNPRIQVYSTGSAALIANIVSKGYGDNPAVNASGVVIANLSLPASTVSGNTIRWNGASATLTAAGASAFGGFYSAGDALDPVSFSFPLGAEVPCDTTTSNELAATGGSTPDATLWLGLSMLVLGAGLVALRRRRALA